MLKIYNSLTRKKEIFKPRKGKLVQLFVCGITPYDFSHIGHARTYLAFDMIAKYLAEKEYDVFYLQNITDIDDKIIERAKENKTSPKEWAKRFEKEYLKDIKNLKIDSVTRYAKATDFIKEIISQIERLKKKGYAYQIKDGIYYDIKNFKNYGKLSRRTAVQAEDGVSRIDESKQKRNKGDFCLWKLSPPSLKLRKGEASPEPKWPSPFGWGRPGWHIEDTSIAEKFFGSNYDMHGGARDLIFPHHEAEIAQMEAISGKAPMAKYWLHTGFLTVKGRKMAKSTGNFITIKDFLKHRSARLLRFLIIKNHYRSPIDYTENAILQAQKELERIDEFINNLKLSKARPYSTRKNLTVKYKKEFEEAMEDDFNTPKAVAVIFELMRYRDSLNAEDVLEFLKQADRFFNFIFWPKTKEAVPKEIISLVKEREKYRKQNKWQKADELRKEITKLGWWVEDTKQGSKIKKLSS
ncbi:MAG: cysteine--tRNA ligase [bacterium]